MLNVRSKHELLQGRSHLCFSPMSLQRTMMTALLVALLICCLHPFPSVHSFPASYSSWDEYQADFGYRPQRALSNCRQSDLCERCAKFTRNEVVYPLCCENTKKVGDWCKEFLEYGLNK